MVMARKLPDDPTKRRLQIFKRLFQHQEHWQALIEDRGMGDVITIPETGEDIYLGDLMVGIDTLPRRQREAFVLICLKGYTETAARDVMLPNSTSSTPVQQYSDSGLVRMVAKYDEKQAGPWIWRKIMAAVSGMATLHPLVRKGLEATRAQILKEMEGLKTALAQVDEILGFGDNSSPRSVEKEKAPPVPPVSSPAPTPRPEGKPDLTAMAKELAATATAAVG